MYLVLGIFFVETFYPRKNFEVFLNGQDIQQYIQLGAYPGHLTYLRHGGGVRYVITVNRGAPAGGVDETWAKRGVVYSVYNIEFLMNKLRNLSTFITDRDKIQQKCWNEANKVLASCAFLLGNGSRDCH